MNYTLWINGKNALDEYGMILGEQSLSTLLTPPPVKEYITNKSALCHGKQVLCDSDNKPKFDERDIQLTFYIKAKFWTTFLTRYVKLCEVLQGGTIDIKTSFTPGTVYHCLYISCTQFSQFNGRLAKFVLKLNEPNPNNRT